jgi:hypothetical protein
MQEFDFFIGRNCAQSAGVVYQSVEGDTVSSIPSGMNDIFNAGGLPHWALKPQRATSGAATTTEQGKVDTALTIAKQGGITGFTVSFWNEYNYGGANGPFGNDTTKNGGDPYGTGNTDATAKANWLAYWANFQPIAAQHGIPAYTKPTYASPSSVSSWHPPAGTVSGVVVDFYMADSVGKGVYLDQSPASGVPSLQDVCDGVRNPNNTTASNPPIALGIGEWGRAGGGSSNHTWAEVVAWSHNSTGTGHLRDFFAARLAAGKQNAAIMWFENNINGPNWIHTPGTNGEDQTAIQAEIRACVDALTVSQITGGNPVITTTSPLPGGQVGIPYSASLAASGGTTPYTWSVTTGRLPEGLTLNASTGQITGSPQAIETVSTGFTVTDAASLTGTATLSTTISPAGLFVPPQTPPAGRVSSPYAMSLIAQGGTPPYTWAVTSGSLPTGLTLAAGGTISGTPSVAGGFSFTVTVTDHASATASLPLTITIATAASLTITTPLTLQSGASGFSYSATLAAIGGTPPYTWAVTSGALPPGLVLSSAGVISGTPIATSSSPVTYSLTITVTDSLSATAPGVFTITIFTIQPTPLPIGPWRFLYGPTQFNGTGGVTAEVIQAQNKTVLLRHEPDQTHEVSFDVDGRSQAAQDIVELENDLIVTFGNEIVFDGRIVPTMDTLTASAHRTQVTAYDYREVLRRRALLPGDTVSWSNVDVSTIAWNMIQATQGHPGGNLGIVRGVGQTTGILRTYTANVGDYIGDDITSLALLDNGFDWQITPYGFSDLRLDIFAPDMNRDTGLVLSYGDGRIASITRTVDPTTFANCVYVTSSGGTGTLTPQHLEAPTIATDPAGHWTSVIGTTDNTQSVLNDHALALLNELQVVTPSYQVVLHPGAWEGPDSLWFGDNITLRIDSGRLFIDEQLQVVEMAFSISPDNVETLTLTLGQIPFRLPKKIASILKRLRYLDTR